MSDSKNSWSCWIFRSFKKVGLKVIMITGAHLISAIVIALAEDKFRIVKVLQDNDEVSYKVFAYN